MDAIVMGAGVAGLTAAYHLKKKGLRICLLEKSNRWGGCLHSVFQNGCLLEKGPNSFLGSQETIGQHIEDLGLQNQVIQAKASARKRLVLENGKLVLFPTSLFSFLRTSLLTVRGKARLFLEPLIFARPVGEESVARFVTRRMGGEALNLVAPMIRGIYAGDADVLSLQAVAPNIAQWEKEHGSLFKALRKARFISRGETLFSFKGGMQTLTNALYEKLKDDCRLNCSSVPIEKLKNGWRAGGLEAPLLILAIPAYEAASLLKNISPVLSDRLNSIPYASLTVIHLVVPRSQINHPLDGFGFLAGRGEADFLLGCLWSSSVFEGRCDDSKVLWTCYARGAGSKETVISKTLEALRRVFKTPFQAEGIFATPLSRALPQYTLGHLERLREIQRQCKEFPGLYLTGNYFGGTSVNDTMQNALQTAGRI